MSSLYKLTDQYITFKNIAESILDSDENLSEEDLQNMINTLDTIRDNMNDKVENIVKFMRSIEGDIKIFKEEEERLRKKRRVKENLYKRLKDYIYEMLTAADIKKMDAGLFKVSIRNSPPSVGVINEELIPDEYKIEQSPKIDNRKILEELKRGKEIEGVKLIDNKTHLTIR